MTTLPQEYLDILASEGRDLKEAGVNGAALQKRSALRAVEALRAASVQILGGDVYRVTRGKLELSYDNWYCKDAGEPGTDEYLKASLAQAKRYIRDYPDPEDGSILYRIVTGLRASSGAREIL